MTTTITATSAPTHVLKAAIGHGEAIALAETAYARFADSVEALGDDDWQRPTDCTGWTVRHLVGHVVGLMRAAPPGPLTPSAPKPVVPPMHPAAAHIAH